MGSDQTTESTSESSFLRQIFSGTIWQGAGLIFSNIASFATKLILARLLVPEYFGLVGMAVVFTGLIKMIERLGIESALVQRPDDELTDVDLYTGHLGAILVGIGFYFAVVLPGAPAVAWFYEQPELTAIVIVLAIPVLIEPFATFTKVSLKRRLQFKELAKIEIFATFSGAIVAITMAFMGAGVWALVAQWVVFSTLETVSLRLLYASPPKAEFSLSALRRLLVFGGYITGQRIFTFISKQADYLIVGKLVGAASLGAYTIAFLLTDAIRSKLMAVMSRVLFPAYSRIQHDLEKLNQYYLGSIRVNTLMVAPILCSLFIYGEELLLYGFGEEWSEAVAPLQLLAVAAFIHTIGGTNSHALKAVDRPELAFKVRMVESMCVMIPALVVGVHYYGLVGAGAAVILSKTFSRLAYHYYLRKIVGTTELGIVRAIAPSLVALMAMSTTLVGLRYLWPVDSLVQTLGFIVLAGIAYLAVGLPLVRDDIEQLWAETRT